MKDFIFYTLRISNPLHFVKFDKLRSSNELLLKRLQAQQGEWFIKSNKGESQRDYDKIVVEIQRLLTSNGIKHKILTDEIKN